jgi:hypothetical protein
MVRWWAAVGGAAAGLIGWRRCDAVEIRICESFRATTRPDIEAQIGHYLSEPSWRTDCQKLGTQHTVVGGPIEKGDDIFLRQPSLQFLKPPRPPAYSSCALRASPRQTQAAEVPPTGGTEPHEPLGGLGLTKADGVTGSPSNLDRSVRR